MKTQRILRLFLVAVVASGMALAGCASTKQARRVDVPETGILGDYSMLEKGKGEARGLRTYRNPNADWPKYTRIIIDPVKMLTPEKVSESELRDYQNLVNNMEVRLRQELGEDYQLVTNPGPGTLRIQAAMFDAEKKEMVSNTLTSLLPIGIGLSLVKDITLGKPLSVGEISAEVKVTDSQTNDLLGAAIDRRVGRKYTTGFFDSWAEANDAIDYWAKSIRFNLCTVRGGGGNCVEPD